MRSGPRGRNGNPDIRACLANVSLLSQIGTSLVSPLLHTRLQSGYDGLPTDSSFLSTASLIPRRCLTAVSTLSYRCVAMSHCRLATVSPMSPHCLTDVSQLSHHCFVTRSLSGCCFFTDGPPMSQRCLSMVPRSPLLQGVPLFRPQYSELISPTQSLVLTAPLHSFQRLSEFCRNSSHTAPQLSVCVSCCLLRHQSGRLETAIVETSPLSVSIRYTGARCDARPYSPCHKRS